MCVETKIDFMRRHQPCSVGISLPLPLESKLRAIKLVRFLWIDDRQLLLSDMRFLINHYWGSYTIAVLVLADYGPVFLPNHRLQMHHSSHSFLVLKME